MADQAQNLPAPRPQITAGGQVAALVPQTLDEAFRVAQAIAASNLAPRGLEKPEQIMVAIMAGAELGFAPFQSLQSFAVVNGKPCLWGDGLVAVVRRNGCTIREWHDGETAFCEVTRPDTGEKIERSFSQADAIKAGLSGKQGPWTQYPTRMRAMRARSWAIRDGCADMLRGFQVAEEVTDHQPIRDVTPVKAPLRERLEARTDPAAAEGFSATQIAEEAGWTDAEVTDVAETEHHEAEASRPAEGVAGEVSPADPPSPQETKPDDGKPTLRSRVDAFKGRVTSATTTIKLKSIHAAAGELRRDADLSDPDLITEMDEHFNARFAALEDEGAR